WTFVPPKTAWTASTIPALFIVYYYYAYKIAISSAKAMDIDYDIHYITHTNRRNRAKIVT
ncbi:MAG: hypothetical protein P4L61_00205, partial [Candidatus Pacebacteria bacterium]|nr:hypothetical protein [Candidatus Paceibacterota bacterium]